MKNQSPIIEDLIPTIKSNNTDERIDLGFTEALKEVINGKSVFRKSWEQEAQILLRENKLQIHNDKGFHDWIISEEDLTSDDWTIVS